MQTDQDESLSESIARMLEPRERLCDRCKGTFAGPAFGPRNCAPCSAAIEEERQRREAEDRERGKRLRYQSWLTYVPRSHGWVIEEPTLLPKRVSAPKLIAKLDDFRERTMVGFIGDAGTGKTALATELFRRMVEVLAEDEKTAAAYRNSNTPNVEYVTTLDLVAARKESRLGEAEPQIITRARRARLLVLDDVGLEQVAFADLVVELIHERHREERQTIFTSGLTPDEIGRRYGGGIARRLLEEPSIVVQLPPRRGS